MDEIVFGAIKAARNEINKELLKELNPEQSDFIKKTLSSPGAIRVLQLIEESGNLFSNEQRLGVIALLSYENVDRFLKSEDQDRVLLALMMATSAATIFLDRDIVMDALIKVEKEAVSAQASKAGRASRAKNYPWKDEAAKVARVRWRESDIFHNELARWLAIEYQDSEGNHPFSLPLAGITEGKEHDALLKLLKKVAKEPEFAGRNLIKNQF